MDTGYKVVEGTLPPIKELASLPGCSLVDSNYERYVIKMPNKHYISCGETDGHTTHFVRYGINHVSEFLDMLSEKFNVRIVSEHNDEFWN